ncbi:MAG: hypothetical protein HY466_00975 [Deltaproteobacteria bacterium]|nr:hypothetical protein [Deltaproteobacteria bacterium]
MLKVLNALEEEGVIRSPTLGGAMALLFHCAEPILTYDVDVFAYLPNTMGLIDLTPVYQALQKRGYAPKDEHMMIEGIPVQFLPADSTPLVEEGVKEAVVKHFQGIPVKVMGMEHLLAIMLETNRPKDRAKIGILLEGRAEYNKKKFMKILTRHKLNKRWEAIIESEK